MKKKVSKVGGRPPKGETTQSAGPAAVDPAKLTAMMEQLSKLTGQFEAMAAENRSLKDQLASQQVRARRTVQTEQDQIAEEFRAETPDSELLKGVIFQSWCRGFRQVIKPSEDYMFGKEPRIRPPKVVVFISGTVRLTAEEDIAGMRAKMEEARKRGWAPMVREVTANELRSQMSPAVDPFAIAPEASTTPTPVPAPVSTTQLPETENALVRAEGPEAGFQPDRAVG